MRLATLALVAVAVSALCGTSAEAGIFGNRRSVVVVRQQRAPVRQAVVVQQRAAFVAPHRAAVIVQPQAIVVPQSQAILVAPY